MEIHLTNPLSDPRWEAFVAGHSRSAAFHCKGWLQALSQTYGYEPFVLTTSPKNQPLRNGVVLCRVNSWITGKRLVSLPFADHCEPLVEQREEWEAFRTWLGAEICNRDFDHVEFRPRFEVCPGTQANQRYWFHELDLGPSLERLFYNLHQASIQRKIKRAEREGLSYEIGCSAQYVDEFYRLLLRTRRRQGLFPQPSNWFSNLVTCMGEKVQIRLAQKNKKTIAAMLTLRHSSSVIYKYGCSDERFHNLGGMPFLFWRLIEESKLSGAAEIDFGRSDFDNHGLITFKDRFGTARKLLTYQRYNNPLRGTSATYMKWKTARHLFSILPNSLLAASGRLFYRHLG